MRKLHIFTPRRKWFWFSMLVIAALPAAPGQADTGSPEAAFLEQLAVQGIPAAYGVILGELSDSAGDALVEGVKGGSGNLATLANQKVWRDKVSRVSQAIGRLIAILDVGGKFYSGQNADAAVAGSLAILGELAGSESGKALLKAYGITPPVVTALIISVQITWDSYQALARETTANQIERLYAAVESMTGNAQGRTTGQGDPFPVTSANIEKIWQRILYDPQFRELFRAYVVDQLQRSFPEPAFFDQVAVYLNEPAADELTGSPLPKSGVSGATLDLTQPDIPAGGFDPLKDIQQRVRRQHEEIKPHVAGLVGYLNRAAKIREQQVVARRQLLELQAKLSAGGSIEAVLEKLKHALAMSGVVETYLSTCRASIAQAADEEDYQSLQVHMKMAVDYVRDVVAWLPATGPTAELHKTLRDGLKTSYSAAYNALQAFREKLRRRIDTPKPPQDETGDPPADATIDPVDYYANYFKPLLEPFDWGGVGGVDPIRSRYEKLIQEGRFMPPKDSFRLNPQIVPLGDVVERAWRMQNFAEAENPTSVEPGQVPAPDPAMTIDGYYEAVTEQIKRKGYPEAITSLQRSLDDQGRIIGEQWKKGNDLYWGRNPKPPPGETAEQRKARMASGQAMMKDAEAAGEALKPARQQLTAMKEAWAQAKRMALSAAAASAIQTRIAYDAVSVWMKGLRAGYDNFCYELARNLQTLTSRLNTISLAPVDAVAPADVVPQLSGAANHIEANAYTHLQAGLFSGESISIMNIGERLCAHADRLVTTAATMRRIAGRAAGEAVRLADAFDEGCRAFDALKTESAEDIERIRHWIDPAFLSEDAFAGRRAGTPKLAGKLRAAAERLSAQAEQHAANMQADGVWLQQVAGHFERFVSLGRGLGIMLVQSDGSGGRAFKTPSVNGEQVLLQHPYAHFLTFTEKAHNSARLRRLWNDTPLKSFADRLAPWLTEKVRDYFEQLDGLPGYKEDNFLVRTQSGSIPWMPVTTSALDRAEKTMAGASPGTEAYQAAFISLSSMLPLEIKYYRENGYAPTFEPVVLPEGLGLARRYSAFRESLMTSWANHAGLWAVRERDQQQQALSQARAQLPGLIAALNDRIAGGRRLIEKGRNTADSDRQAIKNVIAALNDLRMNQLLAAPYPLVVEMNASIRQNEGPDAPLARTSLETLQVVGRLSTDIAIAIGQLEARLSRPIDNGAYVRAFYERFKSAYESRDSVQVMRCIDTNWSAGDGTTLDDLEVTLSRMFDVFDDIRFDLGGLRIESLSGDRARASYDVTITGRIYRNNLKHVEKSTVSEELLIDGDRSRILKTLQGSFWPTE